MLYPLGQPSSPGRDAESALRSTPSLLETRGKRKNTKTASVGWGRRVGEKAGLKINDSKRNRFCFVKEIVSKFYSLSFFLSLLHIHLLPLLPPFCPLPPPKNASATDVTERICIRFFSFCPFLQNGTMKPQYGFFSFPFPVVGISSCTSFFSLGWGSGGGEEAWWGRAGEVVEWKWDFRFFFFFSLRRVAWTFLQNEGLPLSLSLLSICLSLSFSRLIIPCFLLSLSCYLLSFFSLSGYFSVFLL